jgi:hypothetical protein
VPFLRFSRDKRGYEHTYLVHTSNRRGRPARPRILYWYRTPPGIRVGRPPFDEEVRRTIEAHNPGVTFDWSTFAATTIPPAEPEPWWERRRAERVARQARRADDEPPKAAQAADEAQAAAGGVPELDAEPLPLDAAFVPAPLSDVTISIVEPSGEPAAAESSTSSGVQQPAGETTPRRRRRRRGGRRRRGRSQDQPQPGSAAPAGPDVSGAARVDDSGPDDDSSGALDDADDPAENGGSSSEG